MTTDDLKNLLSLVAPHLKKINKANGFKEQFVQAAEYLLNFYSKCMKNPPIKIVSIAETQVENFKAVFDILFQIDNVQAQKFANPEKLMLALDTLYSTLVGQKPLTVPTYLHKLSCFGKEAKRAKSSSNVETDLTSRDSEDPSQKPYLSTDCKHKPF